MPNIGTDIYDKFTYIIKNYDNLPDVAIYTKANLFKYISKEEFEKVKNNKTFTPLLTQKHHVYMPVCFYRYEADVDMPMYNEINNYWYLGAHPLKHKRQELAELLGIDGKEYVTFAPGSNYIVPKENIRKHPKEFYEKLCDYLTWDKYPGEAQMIERALYNIWR